tara:strand:+ start:20582 stop:21220 length:639 start_codon:yes stop_codon:yes gene_type:complete
MTRSRLPYTVPAALFFLSLLTVIFALVQAVQIPLGALPAENARIATAPVFHFAHVIGGATFGLIGPIQFGRVLARRFGRLHRIMGRVFVLAGALLALSSLGLLWRFPDGASPLVSGARLVFGLALGGALFMAMRAIRKRDITRHRDWMIRAYAVGAGATAVSMVFIPIFAITGEPPMGIASDVAFIGSWTACVVFAEWLVRRLRRQAQAARA